MEPAPGLLKIKRAWKKNIASRGPRFCSKVRFRRAFRALDEETRRYFYETSLHGFKYITSPDSTLIEKLAWILVCAVGTFFCIILMCLVWQRFQQNPTVTTIESTSYPIWELPFPAVTICNLNKIYLPRVERFIKEFKFMGLNETEIDDFFSSLPKLIHPDYGVVNVTPGMRALASLGHTIEDLMYMVMQPCDKLLLKCTWLGYTYDCSKIFQTVKSIEGFCCSFNYHAVNADFKIRDQSSLSYPSDLTNDDQNHLPEKMIPSTTSTKPLDSIPGMEKIEMVPGSGRDVGLSVIFDVEGHLYGGATRPYVGALILIHDPQDYPEISLRTAFAETGKEIDISISGTILESVANIRGLSLGQRRCLFDDEGELKFTSEYSYQTCVTECRIDYIRKLCNCVPFYYPSLYPDTRICDLTDINCMRKNRRILSSLQSRVGVDAENGTIDENECTCLPQCSDKWYSPSSQTADTKGIVYDESIFQYYSNGSDIRNLTSIYVYFRDITCLKYRKDILLTWDGFFASFGGIFGLCLGGSVISLVEIFYYYAVRIFHRKKNRRTIKDSKSAVSFEPQLVKTKRNNKKLDEFSIFNNSFRFRKNNFSFDDSVALSEQLKAFRVTTELKRNYLP